MASRTLAACNPMDQQTLDSFTRLSDILDRLRKECPWDKVQTISSLRYLTIEEVFELSDAIIALQSATDAKGPSQEVCKELGDLIMHILFYAKIAEDEGLFSLADVLDGISDKLVSRHPQIYGNGVAEPWEKIKMSEGRKSVLEGVPTSLPSLNKAVRVQEKVAGAGFDYDNEPQAFEKVKEEYHEFLESNSEEEFGDLLFAIVKWGAMRGVNADNALSLANRKFAVRFRWMEQHSPAPLSSLSHDDLLNLWQEAKANAPT